MTVNNRAPQRGKGYDAQRHGKGKLITKWKKNLSHAAKVSRSFTSALMKVFGATSFTAVVVYCMIIFGIIVGGVIYKWGTQQAINKKQQQLDQLRLQIAEQQLMNDDLEARLNGNLDDYIEARARDKLDMVKPGERVFINTVGD